MAKLLDEIIKGRKTFFITPDRTLFPEHFLEDYLMLGYECYFIENDINLSIQTKVEVLLSVFTDSILFFDIDFPIQNLNWPSYINNLKNAHPNALFGVIYAKRQMEQERKDLEKLYLFDIGLQCGCIQLEYQKKNNFGIIERVLNANQAMGRRRNVRAVCRSSCTIQFQLGYDSVTTKLNDISLSHFSFTLPDDRVEFSVRQRLENIQFMVKGLHFHSDAILCMQRPIKNDILYVFAFINSEKKQGLDSQNKKILIPKIYEIMSANCNELTTRLFASMKQKQQHELKEVQKENEDGLQN